MIFLDSADQSEDQNIKKQLIGFTIHFNPFIPEFLKLALPSLHLDMTNDANRGFSLKSKTEWQTMYIHIRMFFTSRLIWIYTVCTVICFGLPG